MVFKSSVASTPETPKSSLSDTEERLCRVLNSAMVSTRGSLEGAAASSSTQELAVLMKTPAYRHLLLAVENMAEEQGLTEKDAAEVMVQTFRRVDQIWSEYLIQLGLERLKKNS